MMQKSMESKDIINFWELPKVKRMKRALIKRTKSLDRVPEPLLYTFSGKKPRHEQRKRFARKIALWRETKGHCAYCLVAFEGYTIVCHVDHILPRSKGGTFDAGNLIAACESCNCRRGNGDFVAFAKKALESFPGNQP